MSNIRFLSLIVIAASLHAGHAQELPVAPPAPILAVASHAFPEYSAGNNLDSLVDSGNNVPKSLALVKTFDSESHTLPLSPSQYPHQHLLDLTSRASFVGSAVLLKRWTYLTADKSFAYSIYLARVTSAFIPGDEAVHENNDIYIIRAGGDVAYRGHDVHAVDPNFRLFKLNEPYIFFGSRVGPHLYKVDATGALSFVDGRVVETATRRNHADLFNHLTADQLRSEVALASSIIAANRRSR